MDIFFKTSAMYSNWKLTASWDLRFLSLVCYSACRYKMDFATVVTEDSDIFTSCPGKTDVRGKGSQFEAAFNFIRHYVIPDNGKDKTHIVCIDSDLKGKANYRNMESNKNNTIKSTSMHGNKIPLFCHRLKLYPHDLFKYVFKENKTSMSWKRISKALCLYR